MKPIAFITALAACFGLPAAAWSQQAFTTTAVNVRAGPASDYPLVARLGPNTPVLVNGCVDGYRWCDVSIGGNRGWVYGNNLSSPYQDRRVPIMGYGAAIGLPLVVFSFNSYWNDYYRGRPWYRERSRWEHRPPPPPPHHRPHPPPPIAHGPGMHPPGHRPPDRPPVPRPRPPHPGEPGAQHGPRHDRPQRAERPPGERHGGPPQRQHGGPPGQHGGPPSQERPRGPRGPGSN